MQFLPRHRCADSRGPTGADFFSARQIAGADFSWFSILQGTVGELVIRICLCGRLRPWLGFTTGTVTGKPGYSRSGQTLEQQQVAVRLVRPAKPCYGPATRD